MVAIENGINYRQNRLPRRAEQEVSVLGDRLKEQREKHDYTQKSFAATLRRWLLMHKQLDDDKKYNITRQQVHEWELGKKVPNAFYLRGMGEILETPTDYLTGATNDPNSRIEEKDYSEPEKHLVRAIRRAPPLLQDAAYHLFNVEPPSRQLPANAEENDRTD